MARAKPKGAYQSMVDSIFLFLHHVHIVPTVPEVQWPVELNAQLLALKKKKKK